jgi:uncharacterized protein
VIFVDTNVVMYLIGEDHPHRDDARRLLDQAFDAEVRLLTSAEVFQEILHRYRRIGRQEFIQPAFDVLRRITDEVFPIELEDVELAKSTLLERPRLSARDALHVAVMRRRAISRIFSFDRGFDAVPGIERVA